MTYTYAQIFSLMFNLILKKIWREYWKKDLTLGKCRILEFALYFKAHGLAFFSSFVLHFRVEQGFSKSRALCTRVFKVQFIICQPYRSNQFIIFQDPHILAIRFDL